MFHRIQERSVLPACRELDIGFVPYSPIGRGILTGTISREEDVPQKHDMRATMSRFQGKNLTANLRMIEELVLLAKKYSAKPSQIALAWLLAQGEHIVPIPGTKNLAYLEENLAAADIALDPSVLTHLNQIFNPERVMGERYGMSWQESADAKDY